MLKVKNVSKSFGNIISLDNISFEVAKGEFIFLMGPSGAGKTTILKLILAEYPVDSGEIIFDGFDINKLKSRDIPFFRQKVGTVFQDFKVLTERTVRENIEVALAVIGTPENEWEERVDQVLNLVGLLKRSELFPSQLSGGELQRTSLARALVVNPKLVLADEPTGNLDWETSQEIVDLLDAINKEGKTVIMATHNEMIVNKLKKRVVYLKEGKIIHPGSSGRPLKNVKVKTEELK